MVRLALLVLVLVLGIMIVLVILLVLIRIALMALLDVLHLLERVLLLLLALVALLLFCWRGRLKHFNQPRHHPAYLYENGSNHHNYEQNQHYHYDETYLRNRYQKHLRPYQFHLHHSRPHHLVLWGLVHLLLPRLVMAP